MVGPVSGTIPGQRTSGGLPVGGPKPQAELTAAPGLPAPFVPALPGPSDTNAPSALVGGTLPQDLPSDSAELPTEDLAPAPAPTGPTGPAADDTPTTFLPKLPGQNYETQEILLPRRSQTRVAAVEAPKRDKTVFLVAAAAAILSAAAIYHFAKNHQILGFQDGYSHLEISRRILVSRTTGIAQLGTIWLPLPHMMQSLFAWNYTLYKTGLAGSFVSGASFVAGSVFVYRTVREVCDGRKLPGIVGAAVFMTNANLLFHQATPMDELPFYAFTLAVVFYLVRWANSKRAVDLLTAAVMNLLAMLCRYEAWELAAVFTVCVVVMARKLGYSWRDVRGLTSVWLSFGAGIAAVAWLIYNWLVTGSVLHFIDGADSSKDQMSRRHGDVEVHNWAKSLHAYLQAVGSTLGLTVVVLGVLGLAMILFRERLAARTLPIIALTSVLPFYVYSLESGQEPIGIPPVNADLLNVRYGLIALLPAALLAGYLAGTLPRRLTAPAAVVTAVGLLAMTGYSYQQHQVVLLHESTDENTLQKMQVDAGTYIQQHTVGPVLVNLVGNERVAFPNLDRVIYEGTKDKTGNLWSRAMADPRSVGADVIVMRHSTARGNDKIYDGLRDWPGLSAYHVAFSNTEYTVYSLNGD